MPAYSLNTNKKLYVREFFFLHDLENLKIKLFVFDKKSIFISEKIFIANQFFSVVLVKKTGNSSYVFLQHRIEKENILHNIFFLFYDGKQNINSSKWTWKVDFRGFL